jgi:hypothetical protein
VFEAEPKELVRRCSWGFTLFHGLLEARPTLRDCALVQLEGLADGVPVNLLEGLVLATSAARVRAGTYIWGSAMGEDQEQILSILLVGWHCDQLGRVLIDWGVVYTVLSKS